MGEKEVKHFENIKENSEYRILIDDFDAQYKEVWVSSVVWGVRLVLYQGIEEEDAMIRGWCGARWQGGKLGDTLEM